VSVCIVSFFLLIVSLLCASDLFFSWNNTAVKTRIVYRTGLQIDAGTGFGRFILIVATALYPHYTDDVREYAYDRKSRIGKLDKGLDEAQKHAWLVIDMKRDWKQIFSA